MRFVAKNFGERANARMVTKTGESIVQKAVFTMVFARTKESWKRVIAHKTVLKE